MVISRLLRVDDLESMAKSEWLRVRETMSSWLRVDDYKELIAKG